jgi:hypothetical protein
VGQVDNQEKDMTSLLLGVPVRLDSRVPRGYIVYVANGHMWLMKMSEDKHVG